MEASVTTDPGWRRFKFTVVGVQSHRGCQCIPCQSYCLNYYMAQTTHPEFSQRYCIKVCTSRTPRSQAIVRLTGPNLLSPQFSAPKATIRTSNRHLGALVIAPKRAPSSYREHSQIIEFHQRITAQDDNISKSVRFQVQLEVWGIIDVTVNSTEAPTSPVKNSCYDSSCIIRGTQQLRRCSAQQFVCVSGHTLLEVLFLQ